MAGVLYPASAATALGLSCFSITFSRSGSKMTLSWIFPGVTIVPRTKPFRSAADGMSTQTVLFARPLRNNHSLDL